MSGPLSVCIMDLALFPLASVARVTRDKGWDAVIPMSLHISIFFCICLRSIPVSPNVIPLLVRHSLVAAMLMTGLQGDMMTGSFADD